MALTPFESFLARAENQAVITGDDLTVGTAKDRSLTEAFRDGALQGAEGISADVKYFAALFNTLKGDDEAVADNIASARQYEQNAAGATKGMDNFEQFLDEPTVEGALMQAFKFSGQAFPSLITAISGGGVGGVTALLGKKVISDTGKKATKRIVKDSLERTAKGVATPDEKQLAQASWNTFKKGAYTGAFSSEYAPLSGQNVSEALDSGKELDRTQALRAGGLGIPQAAIGVAGEAAILKLVGRVAKRRAVKEGSYFGNLAKETGVNVLKGGTIESATEVAQEGIAVANRFSLDDTYTKQDAQLRLAEAAFGGFMGGGPAAGAGTAIAGTARAVSESGVVETTAKVFDRARRMLDESRETQVNQEIDKEQYGDVMSGNTTPESQADLNAQLNAMTDDSSTKKAVWSAGNKPAYSARVNKATEIIVNGKQAYAAFVPGRGTIVSESKTIVEEVVASKANDQSLAIALGYSNTKNAVGSGDIIVQAINRDGGVVSEELTDEAGYANAVENAKGLAPEGGQVIETTVEKALEERNARFQKEPSIRAMDEEAFGTDTEVDFEETVVANYQSKTDPNKTFTNTEKVRRDYVDTFGPTDFESAEFSTVTEAALKEAVLQQNNNPNSIVEIRKTDTGFQVVRQDYESLIRLVEDGQESRIPFSEFIPTAVAKAKKSKFARNSKVVVISPDGKKNRVNLVDLTAAGKRLVEAREGTGFEGQTPFQAAQRGLQEVLADLQLEGYDLQINGQSFFNVGSSIPSTMNATAAIVDGDQIGLQDLMTPLQTIPETNPDRAIAFDEDETGRTPTDAKVVAQQTARPFAQGEDLDAFERFQQNLGRNTVRIEGEISPDSIEEEIDGRSETERMADSPETESQINSTIDRRRGAAPSTSSTNVTEGALKGFLSGLVKNLTDSIKLKNPPKVLSFSYLETKTEAELAELFPKDNERQNVIDGIAKLKTKDSVNGVYLQVANTIVVRETSNSLNDALVLAHEMGHALFKEEMDNALSNPAIRSRLEKSYKNAATYKSYLDSYGYELGFEEWYADQVTRWATKRYLNKQAKSLNDKHFKSVANRLKKLYRELSSNMKKRFGKLDSDFEAYVDAVAAAKRQGTSTSDPNFIQKALVQSINEVIVKEGGEALADFWRASIKKLARNPKLKPLMKIVRTADGVMRTYGGNKIADMFYVRAQTGKGNLGMIAASARKIAEFQNTFESTVGKFDDPTVSSALDEAASSKPTSQLSPKAQQVRKFLEDVYDEYIEPSNTDIQRQDNYYPVVLDLLAIQKDPDAFINLLIEKNPDISAEQARKSVNKLVEYNQSLADDKSIEIDPTDPASGVEQAINLTKGINRELIQKAGFLQSPQESLVSYLRHVAKRVEFNKATKDADGNSILDQELSRLKEKDPEAATAVKEIIGVYLGYQSKPLSPMWRKVNSYGQFLQFVTILPFAAVASLPELAGPVINSKEFSEIVTGLKQIGATIKNRTEAKQFARDIGVVTNEVVANSWVTQAEQDYMEQNVREMSDVFFKAIGLNWFTNFSREFAAGMGVQFITKHARNEFNNPRSERYLSELGLTAVEVNTWIKSGRKLTTPEGNKVKAGLQRFVESSILRPNAAERPIWASDPHWALVWQLKSYFYAYSKVVLGGITKEAKNRRNENTGAPQLTAVMGVFALTALATMPLAMLAMEVREYAKQGLAWLLPGVSPDNRYFRSDRMDWPTYLTEVIDRSGFLGVLTLGAMAHQNIEWDTGYVVPGAVLPFAGPTVETIDKALENGFRVDKTLKDRVIPIYNQL